MSKYPAWIKGHQFSRCVPGEVPSHTASQETRTGCRVSPREELAGWESGVPRCSEESSVLGLILFSFQAVVRSTCEYVRSGIFGMVLSELVLSRVEVHLLLDLPVHPGSPLPVRCAWAPPRLPRAFVVSCGILAGSLSLACLYAGFRFGRSGRHRARESAAHFASGGLSALCFYWWP